MNPFPVLETVRLRLREIIASDAPRLFAIHSDSSAMQWFGSEPMTELQDAENLIKIFSAWRQMVDPGTRWAIEIKASGEFIGTCGLFKWNRKWRSCVIGYELAREAQGSGYMREAISRMTIYGFDEMELNRIEAQVHPRNLPSIKLLKGMGFVQEGHQRQAGYWAGGYHDLLQFGLLRDDHTPQNSTVEN